MMIKSMVKSTSSAVITAGPGQTVSDEITVIKEAQPLRRNLSGILPSSVIRFIILLIFISVFSKPHPVFSLDKPEDHMIFVAGFEAYQKKNYNSALRNFRNLLDKYPDTPLLDLAMYWIAHAYYKIGNQMEAGRYISQLIKQYPDTPMRGVVEQEFFELAKRYEKGEQLPAKADKTDQIVRSDKIITSPPKDQVKTAKMESSVPAAKNRNSEELVAAPISTPPILTGMEKPDNALKHDVKPERSEAKIVVTATPVSTASTSVKPVPAAPTPVAPALVKPTPAATATAALVKQPPPTPPPAVMPTASGSGSKSVKPVPTAKISGQISVALPVTGEILIKGILAGVTYIDIVTGNNRDAYKALKLTNPDRLVIDFPGAKSAMAAKTIFLNRLGISKVRSGVYPDKVRIVLDAAEPRFPAYDIQHFESGLRITLAPAPASGK